MVMKQYDSYKPSGVEWIGQIPSHWETNRIKETTNFEGGSFEDGDWIESKDISETGIRYLTSGNVGVIDYVEQGNGFISEDTFSKLKCKEVFEGDILISRLNEPISRACIIPNLYSRIVTCVDNVIYRPDLTKYNRSFIVYTLNSAPYTDYVNLIARGVTMSRIARTSLGKQRIPVPPLEEQERIAEYLDRRCAEIDGIINKEEQAIALLDELKQSIISEAVTRGLDRTVPLKPSGVDWIGNIPSHWEMWKVSHMFDNIGSGTTPSSSNKEYYTGSEGYHWLQTGDLNDGIIRSTSKMVTQKAIDDYKLKFYPENSLVIAMYGATIGKIGLLDIDTATNQACCVLPSSKVCLPIYAFYQFTAAKRYLLMEAVGGGQPNISQDIIKRTMVPLPPLEEQERIAEYLDKRCAEIDEAKERKQRQIELLREMKQTLISDAVTGRVKVF